MTQEEIKLSEVKDDGVIKIHGCMEFEWDESKTLFPCEYDPDVGVMKYD